MVTICLIAVAPNISLSLVMMVLVLVPIGWMWVTQFIQLMLMTDNDFPTRRDKLIWGMAFIFLFFFAPFAFWGWKTTYVEQLERDFYEDAEKAGHPIKTSGPA